jgi:glycosyltransferase involved in cell wall biosynthesis
MKTLVKQQDIDISVVVPAHHEQELSHRTMRSIWRTIHHAAGYGVSCEVLVVLDRPDEETRRYFTKHQPDVRLLEVDYGDAGPTRNHGVREARGRFVSFIDADDLYSREWLYRVYQAAQAHATMDAVFHSEYMVFFEKEHLIRRNLSTLQPEFEVLKLLEHWHWQPTVLLDRRLALRHPFCQCPVKSGYGYEDWHWFCELIAGGAEIIPVEQTCMFYRKRQVSRCIQQKGTVVPPSRLFDLDVLHRRLAQEALQRPSQPTAASHQHLLARALQTPPHHWPWKIARRCLSPAIRKRIKAASWCFPQELLKTLRARFLPAEPTPPFPDWLLEQWRSIHALEPLLFPDQCSLKAMTWTSRIPKSFVGEAYLKAAEQFEGPFSHIFLTPWLKTGGSSHEVVNYAKAMHEAKLADRILVIATEPMDSPWACRLPPSVQFFDFGRQFANYQKVEHREAVLLRFLLQKQPQVIHNFNSMLGYNIFIEHGNALAERSRLYAQMFCDDVGPEGQSLGFNRFYVPQCFHHLTAALSDHQKELNAVGEIFNFDPSKLFAHYQPIDLAPIHRRPIGDRLDVLWAGRLDRQKRPDLLEAIARRCEDLPITFHVFGSTVLGDKRTAAPAGCNIRYHGPFDGFSSLPLDRFDAFLYTSQWDGMPNVLLEAGASELPIIASDVGGVAELIRHGETGFLARPYDDPEQYRTALLSLLKGQDDIEHRKQRLTSLLAERHSWQAFVAGLLAIPGYVAPERKEKSLQSSPGDCDKCAA